MSTRITFTVEVELERESGKFVSRDELTQFVFDELQNAHLSQVDGVGADGDSVYLVTDWVITEN